MASSRTDDLIEEQTFPELTFDRSIRESSQYSRACFLIVIFISLAVLMGWYFNLDFLKTVLPGLISMKANTAFCLATLATTGLIMEKEPLSQLRFWMGRLLAAFVGSIALLTLLEYAFHQNFGIDEFLFLDLEAQTRWPPGRFAPVTCFNFIFIATALFLDSVRSTRGRKIQQGLILIAWLVSFQALVAYLVGVTYSFGSAFYTQIALHTAIAFIFLCSGLLLTRAHLGFMGSIMTPTLAGRVGRRLLFAAILVPPLINWLQLQGVIFGLWSADFGVLFRVIGNVLFFSMIAFQTSSKLAHAERERNLAMRREFEQTHQRQIADRRLDLIANAIPAFISYMDHQQRYLFANNAYQSWFGVSPEEVIGKTARDILGPAYATAEPYIQQALAGQSVRYHNRILDAKGRERYFEADYIPDFSAHHEVRGFVIIGHDVTEQTRSEASLAAAVRARDELMSICSHELRTPVTSMKLSTQMVLRDLQKENPPEISGDRIRKIIEQSDRQLDRLTRLIEEMLDFARISGGKLLVRPEHFDLTQMVSETIERMRPQFEAASCPLSLTLNERVTGHWDSFRLEQVLTNLLSNSLKYASKKPVEVSLRQDREHAILSIHDHGIGIPEADQQRIFQPYERAVSVYNFGGLGLGLYISAQIVQAHGGTIEVQSKKGNGATFTVILPKDLPEFHAVSGTV